MSEGPLIPEIPALAAGRRAVRPRRPVWLNGERVGSVTLSQLPLLAEHPADFRITDGGVTIDIEAAACEARLDQLHREWRDAGVIVAWRDERYALCALDGPAAGQPRVPIERAASRFWGSLTIGAHANGFVRGADGRPAAMWIAQRSATKPTDPGLFDNLVGGGVPFGEPPAAALLREAWEEAGLGAALASQAVPGQVLRLARDIPEGFQLEWLHAFDLELPEGQVPQNQDGEVQGFRLLPVHEALGLALGEAMTVDAALVTLDFADRHGLLPAALQRSPLQSALQSFRLGQN